MSKERPGQGKPGGWQPREAPSPLCLRGEAGSRRESAERLPGGTESLERNRPLPATPRWEGARARKPSPSPPTRGPGGPVSQTVAGEGREWPGDLEKRTQSVHHTLGALRLLSILFVTSQGNCFSGSVFPSSDFQLREWSESISALPSLARLWISCPWGRCPSNQLSKHTSEIL